MLPLLLGFITLVVGGASPCPTTHNPECFVPPFTCETCCNTAFGPQGLADCWIPPPSPVNFEFCCGYVPFSVDSLKEKDVLLRKLRFIQEESEEETEEVSAEDEAKEDMLNKLIDTNERLHKKGKKDEEMERGSKKAASSVTKDEM